MFNSKIMTSQTKQYKITIHILPNIRQCHLKGKLEREISFFKNHSENGVRRLVPDQFLFYEKALYKVEEPSGQHFSLNIFW